MPKEKQSKAAPVANAKGRLYIDDPAKVADDYVDPSRPGQSPNPPLPDGGTEFPLDMRLDESRDAYAARKARSE